jgi:hypothetical protein
MTDATEPDPAEKETITAKANSTAEDGDSATERKSLWSALNRTNRIAAFVLGGLVTVLLAVAIFGAGVIVGVEFGDAEGQHHGSETSDYRDRGDAASGDREGDGVFGTYREGQRDGDSRGDGDQANSDEQPQPEGPQSSAPATPRP